MATTSNGQRLVSNAAKRRQQRLAKQNKTRISNPTRASQQRTQNRQNARNIRSQGQASRNASRAQRNLISGKGGLNDQARALNTGQKFERRFIPNRVEIGKDKNGNSIFRAIDGAGEIRIVENPQIARDLELDTFSLGQLQALADQERVRTGTVPRELEAAIERNVSGTQFNTGARILGNDVIPTPIQGRFANQQSGSGGGAGGIAGALGFNPNNPLPTADFERANLDKQLQEDRRILSLTDNDVVQRGMDAHASRAARDRLAAMQDAARARIDNAQAKASAQAAGQAFASGVAGSESSATQGGVSGGVSNPQIEEIISQLPPGNEALATGLRAAFGAADQNIVGAQQSAFNQLGVAQESFGNIQNELDIGEFRAQGNFDSQRAFLTDSLNRQAQEFEAQRAAAVASINSQQNRIMAEQHEALARNIDQRYTALALAGGFGSSNGLDDISRAKQDGEQALSFLKQEFGFKRLDVEADYLARLSKAEESYNLNMIKAMDSLESRLGQIRTERIGSERAKSSAVQSILKDLEKTVASERKTKANSILKAAEFVQGEIRKQKSDELADQKSAFQELKWYRSTFGSNPPLGVIEDLQGRLPNIDVQSFFTTGTTAELEKAARKLGAGSSSSRPLFTARETKSNGQPRSLEEYIAVNQELRPESVFSEGFAEEIAAEQERRGQTMGVQARESFIKKLKKEEKELKKQFEHRMKLEYEAKLAEQERNDPQSIMDLAQERTSGADVPKHTRDNAIKQVQSLISRGEFDKARNYIDGLGKAPVATERKQYQAARVAKKDVARIMGVIEELGTQGPGIGQFRNLNPFDDRVVELNQLITAAVPNLARGVFGEVGVLTDQDVKRYTNLMANATLTKRQALTATENLLGIIDNNVRAQLDIQRAAGLDIRDLEAIFFDGASTGSSSEDAELDDYISSLYQ